MRKFADSEVSRTKGSKLKIYQDHVQYNLRKYFFSNRVIQIWNSLPDYVIDANDIPIALRINWINSGQMKT